MTEPRFDYAKSKWASGGDPARWCEDLESSGTENVRLILAQTIAGPGALIHVGSGVPIGFAREWLAWHDRHRAEREASFRAVRSDVAGDRYRGRCRLDRDFGISR